MIKVTIVGTRFCDKSARELIAGAPAGTEVELRPEPTNYYDRNAVKVLIGDVKVGYVKKEETHLVKGKFKGLLVKDFKKIFEVSVSEPEVSIDNT